MTDAREAVARLREQLAEAGEFRKQAEADSRDAWLEIRKLVREAEGILPVTEMSKLSGVSRKTIHQMLKEED